MTLALIHWLAGIGALTLFVYLGFALLLEYFPTPMQQPDLRSLATSWRDTVEIVFAGEADAAMVPTWLRDQYPNLIPVITTREFPGPAVSASSDSGSTWP